MQGRGRGGAGSREGRRRVVGGAAQGRGRGGAGSREGRCRVAGGGAQGRGRGGAGSWEGRRRVAGGAAQGRGRGGAGSREGRRRVVGGAAQGRGRGGAGSREGRCRVAGGAVQGRGRGGAGSREGWRKPPCLGLPRYGACEPAIRPSGPLGHTAQANADPLPHFCTQRFQGNRCCRTAAFASIWGSKRRSTTLRRQAPPPNPIWTPTSSQPTSPGLRTVPKYAAPVHAASAHLPHVPLPRPPGAVPPIRSRPLPVLPPRRSRGLLRRSRGDHPMAPGGCGWSEEGLGEGAPTVPPGPCNAARTQHPATPTTRHAHVPAAGVRGDACTLTPPTAPGRHWVVAPTAPE